MHQENGLSGNYPLQQKKADDSTIAIHLPSPEILKTLSQDIAKKG